MKKIFVLISFLFVFAGYACAEEPVSAQDPELKNIKIKSYVGLLNTTVVLTIPRQFKKGTSRPITKENKELLETFKQLKQFKIKEVKATPLQ